VRSEENAKQYADGALARFWRTHVLACASGLGPGCATKYVTCDFAPKNALSRNEIRRDVEIA
jgi:hypothetical protein